MATKAKITDLTIAAISINSIILDHHGCCFPMLLPQLLLVFFIASLPKGLVHSPCSPCSARYATSDDGNPSETDRHRTQIECALEKMSRVMTPQFFESSNTLLSFYSKMCKSIEVKESKIPGAGLGLFAKKPMKANTVVSFYPAHALGLDDGTRFVSDDPYFEQDSIKTSSYLHCTDQHIFSRSSAIENEHTKESSAPPLFLDVNPSRQLVGGWVSQMINDGATVLEKSENGVLDYYKSSSRSRNCIHIPFGPSPIMATITTKKVKKGEELLTTYGGIYWLGVTEFDAKLPDVGITPAISAEIRASANDLVSSIKAARTIYESQSLALQEAFNAL